MLHDKSNDNTESKENGGCKPSPQTTNNTRGTGGGSENADENDEIVEIADFDSSKLKKNLKASPPLKVSYRSIGYSPPAKIGSQERFSIDSSTSQHFIRIDTSPATTPTTPKRRNSILVGESCVQQVLFTETTTRVHTQFTTQAMYSSPASSTIQKQPWADLSKLIGLNHRGVFAVLFSCCILFLASSALFVKKTSKSELNAAEQENAIFQKELQKLQNKQLDIHLRDLKVNYPNQTSSFWANIESSCRHSVIRQKDPSIVLILSDKQTQTIASRLIGDILNTLLKIANATAESASQAVTRNNDIIIDPMADSALFDLIKERNVDKTKLFIDNKLTNLFKSGEKLVLVNSIESLPAQTMLLFYTYGDDLQNAKFPGIMILMSLNLNVELSQTERARFVKRSSSLTKYAEDYLFNLWSQSIEDDQLRPLFTRIANNVILVNDE